MTRLQFSVRQMSPV